MRFTSAFAALAALLSLSACEKQPRGKYTSQIHLPTGMNMVEQAEFRSDGTCLYGHPPDFLAECKWKRKGDLITIERDGKTLAKLLFKDEQLVLVDGDKFHTPFLPQKDKKAEPAHTGSASPN